MKTILISTVLLTLLASSSLQASEISFSGSLDCSFIKNHTTEVTLTASKGDDYEEEATELYFGEVDGVKAEVLYLPFQYGIILALSHNNVQKESDGQTKANLKLEANGSSYVLTCKE